MRKDQIITDLFRADVDGNQMSHESCMFCAHSAHVEQRSRRLFPIFIEIRSRYLPRVILTKSKKMQEVSIIVDDIL